MTSDEELFSRIQQGDGEALSLLYDRYSIPVARMARKVVQDEHGIEEIVQDVFTRVWKTTAFTPDKGQFGHWIRIVARRIAIDYVRRSLRNRDVPGSDQLDSLANLGQNKNEIDSTSFHQDLAKSLQRLREGERTVIELAYLNGHTLTEIASLLNVPIGTVKTRLHQALKSLKSSMEDWSWEV